MKRITRIATILLALVMVLSLATTAFAEEAAPKTSITITNAVEGQTYKLYRVFDLESYTGSHYAYKLSEKWNTQEFLAASASYFALEDGGYIKWLDSKNNATGAKEFAELVRNHAKQYNIAADFEETPVKSNPESNLVKRTTVVFADIPEGYYMVDTTVGTVCSINTNAPHVEITDKNSEPTINKTVQEDGNSQWGKVNTADLGQVIYYNVVIDVKEGASNYIVHDKMSKGLTFNNDIVIKRGAETTLTAGTHYEVVLANALTDGGTFEIRFKEDYLNTLDQSASLIITYSATLNQEAVAGTAETNETMLSYGEESRIETAWDKTETYTWNFKVFKHDSAEAPLAGAEFKLYRMREGSKQFAKFTETKIEWGTEEDATVLTTPADGYIEFTGLDTDTYFLKETKAPDGYNMLAKDIRIIITENGTVEDPDRAVDQRVVLNDKTVKVLNQSGALLPSTGGEGTLLLTLFGSLFVIGAGVLLVTKRRMSAAQ